MRRVAVITGGSSGIGLAAATLFARSGYTVYELSRSGKGEGGVHHLYADMRDGESVKAAFDQIVEAEGGIDLLINNAGFGITGAVELTDIDDVRRMFDVDFYGVIRCIQCCVPHMRSSGGGRIINISSLAAIMPIPFQSIYSCAKSAINALTFTLANELRPFGISVCALMPGDVRTGFTSAREKFGGEIYGGAIERSVAAMEREEQNGMEPSCIARCLLKIAKKKNVGPLYTAGAKYKLFVFLLRLLPNRFVNRVLGKWYS
ncbi:MAG: SDR family oxidoreductase [Clostridiales bacterium]|jgi:NAD(P)-dependent dehydrogenase (short-subunit alcohol dehydrogenase family)|nr:SDR family oxidoreductase [Clostridiales bacterium]